MSYPHATKPADLLDRPVINPDVSDGFVNDPLPRHEAAHVLAYYFPLVAAESQANAHENHYLQARMHMGAAVGRFLGRHAFMSAAGVGAEIHARRTGAGMDETYAQWTMDQLFEELSTDIDNLLDGAP